MCEPILFGATAAASSTGAATAGLIGFGGEFALGQALGTFGTMASVGGALYSGATQSANNKYMAQIAEYNAQVGENNAIMAERAAEHEADLFDDKLKRLISKQKTGYAKGNVVINQDTPLDVTVDTASEGALERLAILYRGDVQAAADRTGAQGQRFAAVNHRANAGRARVGSYINATANASMGAHKLGLLT